MTQLFTHNEAAQRLGVDPVTLYRWRKAGLISFRKQGRWIRYTQDDLAEFVEKAKHRPRNGKK